MTRAGLLAGVVLVALMASDAEGQDLGDLLDRCAADQTALLAACRELALTFQAHQGGVGLAVAGGSDLPGSASTLGRRLGTVPRVTVSTRLGFVGIPFPDVLGTGGAPAPEESYFAAALRAGASIGILNGFSVAPTIGGILSLDLLGELGLIVLPGGEGFQGGTTAYGVGARLGVLRESFTLPGVSVSLVRRGVGDIEFGDVRGGDPAEVDLDLTATSVRAVVGKDILGIGALAGMGWDRYGSDVTLSLATPGPVVRATGDGIETDRTLYFAGASFTFLIVQLSAEAGLAAGYDPVSGRPSGGYDPTDRVFFGSLAARLTF